MMRTVLALVILISTVLAQEQYSKDTQYIAGSQYRAHDQYRTNTHYNTESHYSTDDQYSSEDQYYNPQHLSDMVQESPSFLGSELEKISEISDDDSFTVLPADLKNFEKLGADLYFNLLVKVMLYSLLISLSLPAILPMGKIILALYNLGSLWLA